MNDEEKDLYATFDLLTPGEFRTILKLGRWRTSAAETEITRQGETPTDLYYIVAGAISIEKSGHLIAVAAQTFIGEIAFLHRGPASATVRIGAGSRYVAWPVTLLDRHIGGRQPLKQAMVRLISADMARKIARA